jgi:tRNA A58 N-methylase Trm61
MCIETARGNLLGLLKHESKFLRTYTPMFEANSSHLECLKRLGPWEVATWELVAKKHSICQKVANSGF